MGNIIQSCIKSIDLYAQPLEIRYKNNIKYSTKISIIFSLLLYFIIIIQIYVQVGSVIKHEVPLSVSRTNYILKDPLNMQILNSNQIESFISMGNDSLSLPGNYIFGYALYDFRIRNYIKEDPQIFTIKPIESKNIKLENGTLRKERNPLASQNCSDRIENSNFKLLPETKRILTNFRCMTSIFDLTGDFIYPIYKYVVVKVILCDSKIDKCKSLNEIDEFFKNVVIHFFDIKLYFLSGEFQQPIREIINIQSYSLNSQMTIKADHFLSREIVYSYDNILPQFGLFNIQPNIYSVIKLDEIRKYYSSLDSNEVLNVYIRSGRNYSVYRRRYLDIFKVTGLVCGSFKILHIFFHALIVRINSFYLDLEICNDIFNMIDPELMPKLKYNPYLEGSQKRETCYGNISTYQQNKNVLVNINDIVLYEAFKFEKYNLINFSPLEIFLYNFGYYSSQTQVKLNIFNEAVKNYKNFKDLKILFNFTINFKNFLKFAIGKNSRSQIFIITTLLNKSNFHSRNISNFKIIKNIISFVKEQDEKQKDVERREILRHTLDKYKGMKKGGGLSFIDEKLLNMLYVDKRILDIFVKGELN